VREGLERPCELERAESEMSSELSVDDCKKCECLEFNVYSRSGVKFSVDDDDVNVPALSLWCCCPSIVETPALWSREASPTLVIVH